MRTTLKCTFIYDELRKSEEENEKISDTKEKTIREKLIEDILDKVYEYDEHLRQYELNELKNEIYSRGIVITTAERQLVVSNWDAIFKSLITKKDIKKVKFYSEEFRWHLFSFGLLHASTNDEAKKMFNAQNKNKLHVFFDDCPEAYLIENANLITADDIVRYHDLCSCERSDLYLFDMEKKWVYVMTHESDLGPYFYEV